MYTDQEFLEGGSNDDFIYVFNKYEESVAARATKNSSKSLKEESLVDLDKWYQDDLPEKLKLQIEKPCLGQSDLVKLMKWKLARGKFRPRLVELAASNLDELVQECTAEGIMLANTNIAKALTVICKLKGIGPATASAVLAAAVPDQCAFFADEVALAALGLSGGLRYTQAEYLEMNSTLQQCALRLNKADGEWGPHRVELAVWAYSMLRQHRPQLLKGLPSLANNGGAAQRIGEKRKSTATYESGGSRKKRNR